MFPTTLYAYMNIYVCKDAKFSHTPGRLGNPSPKNTFFFKLIRLGYKQISYFKATKDLCVLDPMPSVLPITVSLMFPPASGPLLMPFLLSFPCLAAFYPSDLSTEVSSTVWFTGCQLGVSFSCRCLSPRVSLFCSAHLGPQGSWEELWSVVIILISSARMEIL